MIRKLPFFLVALAVGGFLIRKNKQQNDVQLGLASIKNATKVYHAPTTRSPVAWKLHHKNWPICILEIKKNWVKIIDAYGTSGWIEKNLISSAKVLILEDTFGFLDPLETKPCVKFLKNVSVERCKIQGNLCCVKYQNSLFWVPCKSLWDGCRI